MLAILFLFSVFYIGFILTRKFYSGFIIGSVVSVTLVFILLFLIHSLSWGLIIYEVGAGIILANTYKRTLKEIKGSYRKGQILVGAGVFAMAFLLFERSFSYDAAHNVFLIESNLYQDAGAHIPMIRHFSLSRNFLPEVPFYAGAGLLYHFMFDFYAGILEYLGVRIDLAFNLISAFSIAALLYLILEFSRFLFKSALVGILASAFFILNSDLSFIQLIQKYGLSISSFYHNNTYIQGQIFNLAVGKNFLNINTYLNQRHLVFGLAIFLFILNSVLFQKKLTNRSLILSIFLISALPFWHLSVLVALYVVFTACVIFFKDLRMNIFKIIIFSAIFVISQILLIKQNSINQILFNPGFTISNLSLQNFSLFWMWNLGIAIPLVIYGFIVSNSFQKKIFLVFLSLFVIANLFQFSADIFDNHKFFNAWIISVNIFSAFGIYHLFKKSSIFKFLSIASIVLITLSGFLNLFIVKNDVYAKIPDSSKTKFGAWVLGNIRPSDIIFTNGEIYDPASIVGARTYLGRTHYIFLYGADASNRISAKNIVFRGDDDKKIRQTLKNNKITYIIIYKEGTSPNLTLANTVYFNQNFKKLYEDNSAIVYKV